MNRTITLLVVGLLCAIRSFSAPLKNEKVFITGNVINRIASTPGAITVCFCNPLRNYRQSFQLSDSNTFSAAGQMIFTQNMTVIYGNYFINLYVKPGDSVHLTIDASRMEEADFSWLDISGDHAEISTQLNRCYAAMSQQIGRLKFDHAVTADVMMRQVKDGWNRLMGWLDDYALKHHLERSVMQWMRCDTRYALFNIVSDYIQEAGLAEERKRMQLFADDFFDITNAANFQSMYFPIHLGGFGYFLTRQDSMVMRAVDAHNRGEAIAAGIKTLLRQPAGLCRDYMIYSYVSGFLDSSPGLIDSVTLPENCFGEGLFVAELRERAKEMMHPSFPVTLISGIQQEDLSLPAIDIFQYLSSKYPGKVIYVDVYATWCGPCIAEMPFAEAIHKEFNRKDVVFVNLCLESDKDRWKRQIQEKRITGENYFFDGDATKIFMGTYRMPGFPTYMLVDRKGKLVNIRALRPSDGSRLIQQIGLLLNQ